MDYVTPMYGTGVFLQKVDDGVNEIFRDFDKRYFLDIFNMTVTHLNSDVP